MGKITIDGKKIQILRELAGYNRREDFLFALRSKTGWAPTGQTLRNWENNKTKPESDSLIMVAKFFGKEPNFFTQKINNTGLNIK